MRTFRAIGHRCQPKSPTDADLSVPCGTMVSIMTTLFFDQFDSQVGVIGVVAGPAGVRQVGWRLRPEGASTEPDETVQMALGQLREYFAGQRRDFTLPLDLPSMEPASEAVLQTLRTVRYGETISYGELAKLSGTGVPARAIGEVMAANPVPIIIPCHRVVASDGLGGYSGGEPGRQLETKRWLLENEGALPPALV
jgi:methylated-DNA-[protein]-cysteine S-methyltransferase